MVRKGITATIFIVFSIICVLYARDIIAEIELNQVTERATFGSVDDQLRLGMMYGNKDREQAVYWLRKARDNGDQMANDILCWNYDICD